MIKSQIQFLYAAINDLQGTIHTLDTKTNYLTAILLIPLAKLGVIFSKCRFLLTESSRPEWWFFAILISIFMISWLLALIAVFRTTTAIDDPSKHVQGDHPRGSFYAPRLFYPGISDIFLNRTISSEIQFHQQRADLPKTDEEILEELLYEQMKLVYIRTMKMLRSQAAFLLAAVWIASGGFIWLSWLFNQR